MMELEAIIIDDEINNVKLLQHFIENYCPTVKVLGFATTSIDAINLINSLKPGLIFLDIILDEGTGFDVLEKVKDFNANIIFVTAFNDYAIKAFKYNAVDYILKPIEIEELILAVHKVQNNILKKDFFSKDQLKVLTEVLELDVGTVKQEINSIIDVNERNDLEEYPTIIAIPSIKKIDLISIDIIEFIEADGKYSIFHLTNKNIMVASRNIGEYLKILNPNIFFRIHHKYIVNMNAIKNVHKTDGYYCELYSGDSIPIAKRKLDLFNKFLRLK